MCRTRLWLTMHSAPAFISLTKRFDVSDWVPPPGTASNVTLLTAQQTREHSSTALACIPVKPVTSTGLQICHTSPYSAIGPTKLHKQPKKPKGPRAARPIKQEKNLSDPIVLKAAGPTRRRYLLGDRLPALTLDRICRAGVYSCFPPRDHDRLHTGIY